MSDELSFLEEDHTVVDDTLKELGEKIQSLLEVRQKIAFLEDKVSEAEAEEKALSGEEIPTILLSRGLSSIRLATGEKVEIKESVYASVPKDLIKRKSVLKWLSENEGEYLIKRELVVEDPEAHLVDYLRKQHVLFEQRLSVNTNSFKAYLSSNLGMKKGSLQTMELGDIPQEANPFIAKKTIIK